MKASTKSYLHVVISLSVVPMLLVACGAAQTTKVQSTSGMPLTPTSAMAAIPTPTMPPSPLTSPLQAATPDNPGWQTFSHHNDVSFQYPDGWQLAKDGTPEESVEFRVRVGPPGDSFFAEQISVNAIISPSKEIPTFYTYAGDVDAIPGFPDHQTVWDQQITNPHHVTWHLTISGFSTYAVNIDGVEYIGQEGGLTTGRLRAIHYDPTTQLAITLSKDFDRDMLIALHETGPDAVYPAMVPVFEEILQSVSIADSANG